MPRFRLRYGGSEIPLSDTGLFVIGRASSCELVLDDAQVSRRHAALDPRADGPWILDLESRNGVFVNGEKIVRERRLVPLDRVTIGAHELVLVEDRPPLERCRACGADVTTSGERCPRCHAAIARDPHKTLAGIAIERETLASAAPEDEPTIVGSLLGELAGKALALGRVDEAERMLAPMLQGLLAKARDGRSIPGPIAQEATSFALRLAETGKKASWIDWLFELHTATGTLMSVPDVERLHDLVRRARYTNAGAVRRYLERLAERPETLSAAQRFQIQRIEGLLRVVVA